ncbi:hypothetical protein Tsubulata_042040 [Turnera subulata]|uniref:HVA22-like protein n=1 Tax=Turnera subulata TaxID=218843 RepID=A0A9Q0F970_9ROSI|nr:hypothetical protein Tsubulata_042040 [Turnera subulata]
MIGSFLTRGLVMVFGYAYPAYECYKTVEKNKPEIEQLRFWCQYWILVAVLTVCERVGDAFISWVPMYSEAKLAFFIYLWYPKTKPQQQGARARPPPTAPNRQPSSNSIRQPAATQPEAEEPPSPTSSTSSTQHQMEVTAAEGAPPKVPETAPPAPTASNTQKANATSEASKSAPTEAEAMQIEATASSSANESVIPPANETVMEQSIRVTRNRLRKTRSGAR